MAQVFDEEFATLSSRYLESLLMNSRPTDSRQHGRMGECLALWCRAGAARALLSRQDFWAFVALAGEEVAGVITAFGLPLTRLERRELFIYDIAVKEDWQRKGIGRALVGAPRQAAPAEASQKDLCSQTTKTPMRSTFIVRLGLLRPR